MKALTYVEIDIDFCELTYGTAPCTAQLAYTGDKKCFNSLATCQDRPNYDPAPKTIRFTLPTDYMPTTPQAIPCILSINRNPTRLRIAEDLGQRSSVTVTFSDFSSSDVAFGLDPYIADRASNQGTFWGKFRARHPYLLGRPLRLIYGELGQDIADMETRHYIIENASGPSSDTFTITAKDPLKLADDDRAQVPRLSRGTLFAAIDDTETAATLDDFESEYPASGIVAIGKELMDFTRSGTALTLVRAQYGTTAESHDQGALVQLVQEYSSERASAIVADLLTQAGVDPSFWDEYAWQAVDELIIRRQYSALIAKPTAVKKLIAELSEQAGFTIWWDEIEQTIRFDPLGVIAADTTISEDQMLDGSYSVREDQNVRVSQVWVYYRVLNPLENIDEPKNYLSAVTTIDIEAESTEQYGQPAIRQVFSRWIDDRAAAEEISDRILQRYRDPPRRIGFGLMVDAARKSRVDTGKPLLVRHFGLQDDEGLPVSVPIIVTAYDCRDDTATVECEEFRVTVRSPEDPFRIVLNSDTVTDPTAAGQAGFNLRARFDQLFGLEPDEYTEVDVLITAGTVIGSPTTDDPAFDVGDWPNGVTINIVNNGRIAGCGGRGGFPNPASIYGDGMGQPGGVGLYTRVDVNVENNGVIAGGGGGGGAAFVIGIPPTDIALHGGGGAGRSPGAINGTLETGGMGDVFGLVQGGDGGDPGQPGDPGVIFAPGDPPPADGGAAGPAIDGDAFVTLTGAGTVLGNQIN